jgi:DNA polymerase
MLDLMTIKRTVAVSALQFLPPRLTLPALREASKGCRGCPLYKNATQTVFGEGKKTARIILVGEQPGNEEDLSGHPFVGPAGRVLDDALGAAGIAREDAYVTNVVKHFKWVPKGTRRMHKKPGAREIAACLPWLEKEIELIRPRVLVCMGATAAQAVLGREVRVSVQHGRLIRSGLAPRATATVHPSAVLRQATREDRHREMESLIADLVQVRRWLEHG